MDEKMNNRSFFDSMKMVLLFLGITAWKLVHLGRNLAAKLVQIFELESTAIDDTTSNFNLGRNLGAQSLEMMDGEPIALQAIGNWNPSPLPDCSHYYSSKLPMVEIRKFTDATEIYYNPWTMKKPGDILPNSAIAEE